MHAYNTCTVVPNFTKNVTYDVKVKYSKFSNQCDHILKY